MAATSVVLLSMLVGKWTGWMIDGYASLLVALFIVYTGIRAAKETISPLLGQPPTKEFVEKIERIVRQQDGVIGVHDLVVHDYGPGRRMISLHAEVPADGNLINLHDTVDNLEKLLHRECGCEAVIHMDPVDTNNKGEQTASAKDKDDRSRVGREADAARFPRGARADAHQSRL